MPKERYLTTCDNSVEAECLKAKLGEAGIACRLHDESVNKAVTGPWVPGVEAFVYDRDYDRARQILDSETEAKKRQTPWCPKCGSEDVSEELAGGRSLAKTLAGLAILAAAVAAAATIGKLACVLAVIGVGLTADGLRGKRKKYVCHKCGHTFS